jgi:hypothetical protein
VLRLLVFGLVVAGGALATWHARGQALLVQDDLVTARELLARPAASRPASWRRAAT